LSWFSLKYKPLFDLPKAQEAIKSEDFDSWSKEKQEYWTQLSEVETVIMTGGRGSGKSKVLEISCADNADIYSHQVYYTRFTNESLSDSVIKDFEESLELAGIEDAKTLSRSIKFTSGGEISFRGLKRGSKAQTAGGKGISAYNCQVVEEAEEHPSLEQFEKMQLSMRNKKFQNYSILNLNPTTKEHWIYKEFFEERSVDPGFNGIKGEILYIHTTYLDVKKEFHTPQNWKKYKRYEKAYNLYNSTPKSERGKLTNRIVRHANYYKFEILGGWKDKAEGVIYDNWEYGEFPDDLIVGFGMDFGFSPDPTTMVKVSIDRKKEKIYVQECFYETELSTKEISQNIYKYANEDDLIIGDNSENRLINELADEGHNILKCSKKDGIANGIRKIHDYTIVVCGESQNLITELNNYVWNDKKASIPIDAYNHALDALRYIVERLVRELE
jgi:phage terminase large subunit